MNERKGNNEEITANDMRHNNFNEIAFFQHFNVSAQSSLLYGFNEQFKREFTKKFQYSPDIENMSKVVRVF